MAVEYTVKLNNQQEVAAWKQATAAQVDHDNQLKKNARSYKGVTKEVDDLIRELKIEQQLEDQIASERQKHARQAAQTWDSQTAAVHRYTASLKQNQVQLPPGANSPMPPHLRGAVLPWLQGATGGTRNPMAPWINGANQTKQALQQAGAAGQQAFGASAVGQLQSYVAGLASIYGVLALAKQAWSGLTQAQEAWINKSKEIKDFNLSVAGAETNAILNLTGLDNKRRVSVVEKEIPAMQKRLGFGSRANLLDAVGATFAASGGNIDQTLETVEAAAKLSKNKPELLPLYASLAADLKRSTGVSPKEALSFGLQVNTRVDDPAKQAAILPKVIAMAAAASTTDDNKVAARSGQAMLSAMTLFTADKTGEKGSTATDKFLEYTSEFFQEHPGMDPGTPHGRMLALEKNKPLRDELYEHLSKKGAIEYRPAIRAMIEPGTLTNRTYHSEFERVNFGTQQYDDTVKALESTANLKLGTLTAAGEANIQGSNTNREGQIRALQAEAERIGHETMDKTDIGALDSFTSGGYRRIGEPIHWMRGESQADTQLRYLKARAYGGGDSGGRDDYLRAAEQRGDTEAAATYRGQLETLERQIKVLEDIKTQLAAIAGSNASIDDKTTPTRNGGPGTGGRPK